MSHGSSKPQRLATALLLPLLASASSAGERPRVPTFAVDVEVVSLNLVVTDTGGRLIDGLHASDIELLEDGIPQPISLFAQEEWPVRLQVLLDAGVRPAGLGARDTLRLEAGMNLYGQDMDETTTPLESGLAWTVAFDPSERGFIGRDVLEKQRADGVPCQLIGLVLEGKGVLRGHQKVYCNEGEGEITSGSFSPTLDQSIALARMPVAVAVGQRVEVDIRGRREPARVVRFPFVRNGKSCL